MNSRTRFLTTAFAAMMFFTTSACVVVSNGSHSGNVTFLWSFNGQSCAMIPGVASVTIQIPGQSLDNNGSYACSTNGTAGITLLNFAPGTYSYDIQGRDTGGNVIYQDSGSFRVNGDVTVTVNMAANQSAPGAVSMGWTFPPSSISGSQPATCAQTSGPVTSVTVSIDNGAGQEVSCAEGQTQAGAVFTGLLPGNHSVDLLAHDSSGFAYYHKASSFTVIAGTTASADFTMDWYVGSLPVAWTFSTASQAGVACGTYGTVWVNLSYTSGGQTYLWYSTPVAVPCAAGLPYVYGYVFDYVYAGTYTVLFYDDAQGHTQLYTTPSVPQLTVTAGNFSTTAGSPITVSLP